MKTWKKLVSLLLAFSMIASMFLTVVAVENDNAKAGTNVGNDRTGLQFDRVTTQGVLHPDGEYKSDKGLDALPVTYEFWAKVEYKDPSPLGVGDSLFAGGAVMGNRVNGDPYYFVVEVGTWDKLKLTYGYEGGTKTYTFYGVVTDLDEAKNPAWYHYTIVHDAANDKIKCYRNGAFFGEVSAEGFVVDPRTMDNPIYLGSGGEGGSVKFGGFDAFSGILGDVALYSDVRTEAEIKSDFENGVSTTADNLLAAYEISADDKGKEIADVSGNGNNLKWRIPLVMDRTVESYSNDKGLTELPQTYEMWVYLPAAADKAYGNVLFSNVSAENGNGIRIDFQETWATGEVRLIYIDGASWDYVTAWVAVPLEQWTHVVIVHDIEAKTAAFYVNGQEKNGEKVFDSIPNVDTVLANKTFYLAGTGENAETQTTPRVLGEFSAYSDMRTAEEIAESYKNGPDLDDENIMFSWDLFENGKGCDVEDKTGNGYDLNYSSANEPDEPEVPEEPTIPESYENCIDVDGNLLNPVFVNGDIWVEENGKLKVPSGPWYSFLLFDNELKTNRVEATFYMNGCCESHDNRTGLAFALEDLGGDRMFGECTTDVSYYRAFIGADGKIGLNKLGGTQVWSDLCTETDVWALGIDVSEGVTLAAEWDAEGNIKVYANGKLALEAKDETPLTGTLYGIAIREWCNTGDNYNDFVTSFVAGGVRKPVYENCTDADGNPLNVNVVNGATWVEENGGLKMPSGHKSSFLLFDKDLGTGTKRIEATILPNDLHGDGNHRNGIVFALTDYEKDSTFAVDSTDVGYYWACISGWQGKIQVLKMGKDSKWNMISAGGWETSGTPLADLDIDLTDGVTLAVEWDNAGHIKVFADGKLVDDITDSDPLDGPLYGMLADSGYNTEVPNTYDTSYTSFKAGTALAIPDNEVSVTVDPTEGGTFTGAGSYYLGQSVTLTATPNPGYNFVGWLENGKLVSADATYTFNVTADCNLTASFTTVTYTVTVTAQNGTATGGGTFGEGAEVTVTATPNTGYKFVGWYENGKPNAVSMDATYTFTVTVSCSLTAKFEKVTSYSVAVDADGKLLNPVFVNGVTWIEEDGGIKMPSGNEFSYLLFDTPLANNRVEATIENITLSWSDADRNGLVFALEDIDGDLDFANTFSEDVAYYWVAVQGQNNIQLWEMGAYQNWTLMGSVYLPSIGNDLANGGSIKLAAEWDANGTIRVFANDALVIEVIDETPLKGSYYGMLVRRWANTPPEWGPDSFGTYSDALTSFVAGGALATPDMNVEVTIDPTEGGSVTGEGDYYFGQNVTLTATPNEGYKFVGWYENGEIVSKEATMSFNAETSRALTAKFVSFNDYQHILVEGAETNVGEEVVVTLVIKNNPGIAGLVVSLNYNTDVLTLIGAENGTLFSGFTWAENMLWDEEFNVTEDGVLATLTFAVAEGAELGDYTIEVIVHECYDVDTEVVDLVTMSGTITVTEAAEDIIWGDANDDGVIDTFDIVSIAKYVANYNYNTGTSTEVVGLGADANGDGVIDTFDIVSVAKYVANYNYNTGTSTEVLGPQ